MKIAGNSYYLSTVNRKTPAWKRVLRTLFRLTILAGFFVLAIKGESYFTITEIRVTGTNLIPVAEIIKASGVDGSRNIFMLREKRAVEQILSRYPQLEAVEVSRSLPGSVEINVTERVPVAVVMTADGYWMIDKYLICFNFSAEQQDPVYPLITGLDGSIGVPGLPLGCSDRAELLQKFFAVWEKMEFVVIRKIDLSSNYNLVVHTDNQVEIWLGDSSSMEQKLLLVEGSLPYLQKGGHLILDVRSGSRLAVAGNAVISKGEVEP